jgi:signal transduction histidine kinase
MGGNLLIPFFEGQQILGFVVIHAPRPPEQWGTNWGLIPIVYPFFEQVAQVMRSLEVYVRQREKERLATLGEMAAGLAHEIRNPLGAIKGAAQFLDPSEDRPESRFLKVIIEETDRLNRVVSQFLDYSKPFAADLQTVELSQLIAKTLDHLRLDLPAHVKLEFEPALGEFFAKVAAEPMQQVLINLVRNGIKAVDGKSHGVVRVQLKRIGKKGYEELLLSVEDNGKGIQ